MNNDRAIRTLALFSASFLFFLFEYCKQSTEPATTSASQTVIQASDSISSSGGTVQVTNVSSPLFGVKVVIPAGALATKALITISTVSPSPLPGAGLSSRGPFVAFGPDGLNFTAPVTITMPSSSSSVAGKTDLIYDYTDSFRPISTPDSTAETHGQSIDVANNRISVWTTHFSNKQPLGKPDIENLLSTSSSPIGTPVIIAIDPTKCLRCKERTTISRIIVHSTNDGGSQFANIIAWIHGSIGDKKIVFNDPTDIKGHIAEAFFATYYVDKDGTIIQLVNNNIQTSHIANQNTASIGIELFDGSSGYTPQQVQALDSLTRKLMSTYQIPRDSVKRHKDYTNDPLHQDPYKWTDGEWNSFKAGLPGSGLSGTWAGTWNWSGPGSNGCFFTDGGSFSITLLQSGSSFTGSNVSASGIETRDDLDCHLWSVDASSGGTASGSIVGNTVMITFSLSGSVTTLNFTGSLTLTGNTLNGSIVRSTGGSGSLSLTRQ